MPESFGEVILSILLSLQMGPGLGSLERGIEEEEGEKGKVAGREEECQVNSLVGR